MKCFPLLNRRVNFREAIQSDANEHGRYLPPPINGTVMPSYARPPAGGRAGAAAVDQSAKGRKNANNGDIIDADIPLKWRKPLPIGPGLLNTGNSCYINAALQCLTYMAPLTNYVLSDNHTASCKRNDFCSMCALSRHLNAVFHQNRGPLLPKGFIQGLKIVLTCIAEGIAKHLRHTRQEDSHEFLRFLIDSLQARDQHGMVKRIFSGSLCNRVKCLSCGHVSEKIDPLLDLSLDISHSSSLDRALNQFSRIEKLDGRNQYKCDRCGKLVNAQKSMAVHTLPPVLTIQLKRFEFGRFGGIRKVSKFVSFPERLQSDTLTGRTDHTNVTYSLAAVLVHSGQSSNSGHYYAFVKSPSSIWYRMDDTDVSSVKLATVLSQHAYVLFYCMEPASQVATCDHIRALPPVKSATSLEPKSERRTVEAPPKIVASDNGVKKDLGQIASLLNCFKPSQEPSWPNGNNNAVKKDLVKTSSIVNSPMPSQTPSSSQKVGPKIEPIVPTNSWNSTFDLVEISGKVRKRPSKTDIEYDRGRLKKIKRKNKAWSVFENAKTNLFTEFQVKKNRLQ